MRIMSDSYNLHPLWDALIDILRDFDAVCKKNGLRYFGAYGTALGAVRHGGFIPWDDDLDVIMPRPDYDRLLRIAEKELPPYLKAVNYRNTPEFNTFTFLKIQDARSDKLDRVAKETGLSVRGGLFIDIFPLDGCSASWRKREPSFYRRIRSVFYGYIYRHFKSVALMRICDAMAHRLKWNDSEYVGVFEANWAGFTTIMPKSYLDGERTMEFCGFNLPVPLEVEKHLTDYYGNYMQLPPESQRVLAHGKGKPVAWRLGPTTDKNLY